MATFQTDPEYFEWLRRTKHYLSTRGPLCQAEEFLSSLKQVGWFQPYTPREKVLFEGLALDGMPDLDDPDTEEAPHQLTDNMVKRIYSMIHSKDSRADRTVRSEHYIDQDTEDGQILEKIAAKVNKERKASKGGDANKEAKWQWLPHQLDGIGIAKHLEESRGCLLLADDMGLGKTAQIAGLLAVSRCNGPTLIVAPPNTFTHWQLELSAYGGYTEASLLVVPAGSNPTAEQYEKATVVIISYHRLVSEYKTMSDSYLHWGVKRGAPWATGFPDPDFKPPGKAEEALQQLFGSVKREPRIIPLNLKSGYCPIFAVKWGRLVLEEGHAIRNSKTRTFLAACAVKADKRVVITGTPFVNEYHDAMAYFTFFKIAPLDNPVIYKALFIKKVKTKAGRNEVKFLKGFKSWLLSTLMNGFTIKRSNEGCFEGKRLMNVPGWEYNRKVLELDNAEPLKAVPRADKQPRTQNTGLQNLDCQQFFQWLKEGEDEWFYNPSVAKEMLDRRESLQHLDTFEAETELYSQYSTRIQWCNNYRRLFKSRKQSKGEKLGLTDDMIYASMATAHYASPFAKYSDDGGETNDASNSLVEETQLEREIARNTSATERGPRREEVRDWYQKDENWRSTKIDACLNDIKNRLKESSGSILIFSTFLSVLDAMHAGLDANNIDALRYDGTLTDREKDTVIKSFQRAGGPRVMLLTTAAGGQSLNLQNATTICLLNMVWSPASENQAIGRAIRIGQMEIVHIFRYEAKMSIDCRYFEKLEDKKGKQEALSFAQAYSGSTDQGRQARKQNLKHMEGFFNMDFDEFKFQLERAFQTKKQKAQNKDSDEEGKDEIKDSDGDIEHDTDEDPDGDCAPKRQYSNSKKRRASSRYRAQSGKRQILSADSDMEIGGLGGFGEDNFEGSRMQVPSGGLAEGSVSGVERNT